MNFIDRFKNGWQLFLNSIDVMRKNKSLLLFPVATAALTFVMAGLFLAPIALQPTGHAYTEAAHWSEVGSRLMVSGPPTEDDLAHGRKENVSLTKQAYAYVVLFYFVSMFLATFFNVAFTHEIFNALNGEPVTISDGLQFAGAKWKPILMWTLFAGVVGLLISALERKFGLFGRWVIKMIGVAWSVAAVFVIPVLVMEEHPDNPIGVVRQSAGVIRKTWGEALAGYAGLQIGGMIVGFGSFTVVALAVAAGIFLKSMGLTIAVLSLWFVFVCAFSYAMSVASQIYLCVLYRFATSGTVPENYTPEMLSTAWRPKKA
jgi:hypothetical protein